MKLHEISVKRPIAVTMVVLIFVVIGLYSLSMLPIELMPEMEMNYALVYTSYSNAGSSEVESLVTKTIEGAISSVSGIDTVQSQSSEGTSVVMASFAASTDMDKAVTDMEDKIDLIEDYLPENCEEPMVMKLDMTMMPSAMMSISYEGYDLIQTKKFVEDNLQSQLESVDGVASISIAGARDRIIEVEVDPEKLYGYNMTVSSIASSIAAQNMNMPAGTTEGMNKNMAVRALGKFASVKDIENVPLNTATGQIIYLKDVANIEDTYSDYSNYARLNGENAISVTVTAESDANTVDVVNGVMDALEKVKAKNPKFTYNMTMEQASFIEDAISSVASNAVTGALLAIIILLLFLGNIKTSLVIGVTMPVSVITTFVGMYFSGMSLNVVSLGGLALGVGMLVDNAVVVIENIYKRKSDYGESAEVSAIKGAGQMISPVIASVLTTCIVYVPILFIDNMMAVMFKQLAFSIIFSQISSLLVTFLIIPMFTSKMEDGEKRTEKLAFIVIPFEKIMNLLYDKYKIALKKVLGNCKRTIALVIGVFVLSLVVLGALGMTLIPSTDEGTVTVSISMPQGTKVEDTNELSLKVEDKIKTHKDVETIFSNVGSSGAMSSITGSGANSSSITVTLNEKRRNSTDDTAQEIRELLKDIAGAEISVATSNTAMSGMTSDEISFEFTSGDDALLEEFVKNAEDILSTVEGVAETETSIADTKSEARIKIDSARAAKYGFNTATLSGLVKSVLDSTTASRYTESGSEYDIKIVYPDEYVKNYNQLKNLQVKSPMGQWVSLSDIGDVVVEQGYTTLTRVDQKRVVTLTGKLYDANMGKVKADFEKRLDEEGIPDGVSINTSGTYEIMIDAMSSLLIAILLGILLMYFVMAAQFESLKQPFIILFTIPLCMIGVVLALVVTGSPLSVVGCIGILMLTGIIVNNAIVLIDYANTIKREKPDMPIDDLMIESGIARMRPILMTSLTSILGFLPMAMSNSGGAAMMQPLAIVLIGGLAVGTLLTLFVIPVVYKVFETRKTKKEKTL
ncbi:MAG: efflux RND transporter permease subunit [Clostridia bacterium]|nr:efflux RND transporter permease subunit [Clostridia bacterium]